MEKRMISFTYNKKFVGVDVLMVIIYLTTKMQNFLLNVKMLLVFSDKIQPKP